MKLRQSCPMMICLLALLACEQKRPKDNNEGPESFEGNGVLDGNGGGSITYKTNPWFVGEYQVKYCVESSADFSIPLPRAEKIVANVIKDWTTTLPQLEAQEPSTTDEKPLLINGKEVRLTTTFTQVASCGEDHDLQFKLGTFDEKIDSSLRMSQKNLVGLSLLVSYDKETGRGRGEIFIAPDRGPKRYAGEAPDGDFWQDENKFADVLLHEVGHAFGFQHDLATFMNQGYPGYRLNYTTKQRISSSVLVNRDLFANNKSNMILGDLQYENQNALNKIFGEKITQVALSNSSLGTKETQVIFMNGNPSTVKGTGTLSSNIRNFLSVEGIYASQEHTFVSYVDNFEAAGKLVYGGVTYPFTLNMVFTGFELKIFNPTTSQWGDARFITNAINPLPLE